MSNNKVERERAARTRDAYVRLSVACAHASMHAGRAKDAPREFDELLASGRFTRIAVEENVLLARTHMVWARGPEHLHKIGEYVIEITPKHFAAYNITHRVEQYHGPHINPSGTFCMGATSKEEIMSYIGDGRLDQALYLVEEATRTFGTGVPYGSARIELWPTDVSAKRGGT